MERVGTSRNIILINHHFAQSSRTKFVFILLGPRPPHNMNDMVYNQQSEHHQTRCIVTDVQPQLAPYLSNLNACILTCHG